MDSRKSWAGQFNVPASTDPRIEALCARIRVLCSGPVTLEIETELRELARELRIAIRDHLRTAKSSLSAKQSAILSRDPDKK